MTSRLQTKNDKAILGGADKFQNHLKLARNARDVLRCLFLQCITKNLADWVGKRSNGWDDTESENEENHSPLTPR